MTGTDNTNSPAARGPLHGLRVLDAGTMIAGPLAATQMADFGAEVIKVELPGVGDSMRHWSPMKNGLSLWWKVIGRNKRLITLNLSSAEGQGIFKDLVRTVDVVIENYRPGTFERWGLGYDVLSQINPKLVMVRVSGFGQTGPYAHKGGYGTIAEAFSGMPSFTGFPEGPPTLPGFPLADSIAATFAAMSAMFALYNRDHNGQARGQVIDVSLYEPLFRLVEAQAIGFDQLGIVKERQGNRLAEDSPRNIYLTKDDKWIAISASSQKTFERFAHAMDRPDLISDSRYRDNVSRCDHADTLDRTVADWFATKTQDEVLELFDKADVVAGPVMDIKDIFSDPHYSARETIVPVQDDDFGEVRMQNAVPRFSVTPGQVRHSGRRMGADNEAIYLNELGLSDEKFQSLRDSGVI